MGYGEFLTGLFEEGRVVVPEFAELSAECLKSGDKILAHYEQLYRLELPEPVPPFHLAAGRWGAIWFLRASQFFIYRNLDVEVMRKALDTSYPDVRSPEVHFSVDLVMKYLPDVTRFSSIAAEQDPLLKHLLCAACDWPLSSVGMANVEVQDLTGIVNHPGLLRLYVDRILATGDKTRLRHPQVKHAVQQVLGYYPQLAKDISDTLTTRETQDSI